MWYTKCQLRFEKLRLTTLNWAFIHIFPQKNISKYQVFKQSITEQGSEHSKAYYNIFLNVIGFWINSYVSIWESWRKCIYINDSQPKHYYLLPSSRLKIYGSYSQRPPTTLSLGNYTCLGLLGENLQKHSTGLWLLLKSGVFCHWLSRGKEWKSIREDIS